MIFFVDGQLNKSSKRYIIRPTNPSYYSTIDPDELGGLFPTSNSNFSAKFLAFPIAKTVVPDKFR